MMTKWVKQVNKSILFAILLSFLQTIVGSKEQAFVFQLVDRNCNPLHLVSSKEGNSERKQFLRNGFGLGLPEVDQKIKDLSPITTIFMISKSRTLYYNVAASEYVKYSKLVKNEINLNDLKILYNSNSSEFLEDLADVVKQSLQAKQHAVQSSWSITLGNIDEEIFKSKPLSLQEPFSKEQELQDMKDFISEKVATERYYIPIVLESIGIPEDNHGEESSELPEGTHQTEKENNQFKEKDIELASFIKECKENVRADLNKPLIEANKKLYTRYVENLKKHVETDKKSREILHQKISRRNLAIVFIGFCLLLQTFYIFLFRAGQRKPLLHQKK